MADPYPFDLREETCERRFKPTDRFRPVTERDFDMLTPWKHAPHVAECWDGDPHAPDGLRDPRVAMRIVEVDGVPFAFVQD